MWTSLIQKDGGGSSVFTRPAQGSIRPELSARAGGHAREDAGARGPVHRVIVSPPATQGTTSTGSPGGTGDDPAGALRQGSAPGLAVRSRAPTAPRGASLPWAHV